MGIFRGLAVVVLGMLVAVPANADDDAPIVFEPSSAWVVEYADEYCSVRRAFQNLGSTMYLEIRQYSPSRKYELFVVGDWKKYDGRRLHYRFTPDPASREREGAFGLTTDAGLSGAMAIDLWGPLQTRDDIERGVAPQEQEVVGWASAVDELFLEKGFGKRAMLRTGPLDQIYLAMTTCLDELVTHWGVDVAAQKNLRRPVEPKDQMDWAQELQANYPSRAVARGLRGPINVRLNIDRTGKPTDCSVIASLSSEILNDAACDGLMKHADFMPAIDADGYAVDSYWVTSIIYWIARGY